MARFRKIGILSSGGDAPGMNAAIRAAARRALSQGIEVVGIQGGYAGLLSAADESDPEIVRQKYLRPFDTASVSNIVYRGGTILYSSRCPEFKTQEGMDKALKACHDNGIVVNVWTVNELEDAKRLAEYGVDFITTNILE